MLSNSSLLFTLARIAYAALYDDPERPWSADVVYDFLITEEDRCDFDVVYGKFPTHADRFPDRPTVYRKVVDNSNYNKKLERPNLYKLLNNEKVTLSNAVTHSHGQKVVSFPEYLDVVMDPPSLEDALSADARTTWYQFGGNYWDIVYEYNRPAVYGKNHTKGALSFGIGRTGSGVPFHTHGPVIAEVFHGKKRWFMSPNHLKPEFDPNISSFTWYYDLVTNQGHKLPIGVETCIAEPGDLMFVPNEWWHATLNVGECVFMAMFLEGLNKPSDNECIEKQSPLEAYSKHETDVDIELDDDL